jgi:hypothetical protein
MPTLTANAPRKLAEACHFLSHREENGPICLREALDAGMPVVIALEPYHDTTSISINLGSELPFNAICYHLHSETDAYVSPSFINSPENIPERTSILLSYDTVVKSIRHLRLKGFNVAYVMIEEGWQQCAVNHQDRLLRPCLASFDADSTRFPNGLRGLVDTLKDLGVNHVGVCHEIMGSRHGIHPDIARNYHLHPDETGQYFLGYDLGKSFQFYFDYYLYLRQQGITFVKASNQLDSPTFCQEGIDVTLLHQQIQMALQGAASIHFNMAPLNSDCISGQNLWYWSTSQIAQAAEDANLNDITGISRTIRNNLVNSAWLGMLMQPDFGVWRTDADSHEMLAIFHALSGSLMQIGDHTGPFHASLLKKMVLPSGKVLLPDHPLALCQDSLFSNPLESKLPYKAFTLKHNIGIVAAFNLSTGRRSVHGEVSKHDICGLTGNRFAVFSLRHGFIKVIEADDNLAFTLKARECDIFTFSPITNGVAVIGCHSFFLAPGPLTEVVIEEESIHIGSIVAAPLLVYCEHQIHEVRCNNELIPWEYDNKLHLLSLDSRLQVEEIPAIYSISLE